MSFNAASEDTHDALQAAKSAVHALKAQLDGYAAGTASEGAPTASACFAAISAAIAAHMDELDSIADAVSDARTQNA